MNQSLITAYASILEQNQAATFEHNDIIYRIWANDEGWYLELLEENDSGEWVEIDGGLCTGSAIDAIEFMLPQEAA